MGIATDKAALQDGNVKIPTPRHTKTLIALGAAQLTAITAAPTEAATAKILLALPPVIVEQPSGLVLLIAWTEMYIKTAKHSAAIIMEPLNQAAIAKLHRHEDKSVCTVV